MAPKGIRKAIAEKIAEEPDRFNDAQFSRRENLHAFFRYPAMMVPSVQQDLITIIKDQDTSVKTLWDPFMGAGTALVAGMRCGLECYGQDINPLAVLVAKVKTSSFLIKNLRHKASQLKVRIENPTKENETFWFTNIDKWFTHEVKQQLTIIRTSIIATRNLEARQFFWVVFAETIRFCSNDRTTTFKLHARDADQIASRRVDCFKEFETRLDAAVDDVELFTKSMNSAPELGTTAAKTRLLDTRVAKSTRGWPKKFDLVVTSPPYGDNGTTVTYGQYSYLQLQWLDRKDIPAAIDNTCVRTTQEIDQQALGGRRQEQFPPQSADALGEISKHFRVHYKKIIDNYGGSRAAKLLNFCNDLYLATKTISRQVRPSGYMIWTIGNRRIGSFEIPNDLILKDFLNNQKCRVVAELVRDIRNKTMPSKNDVGTTMKHEKILVFKKQKESE